MEFTCLGKNRLWFSAHAYCQEYTQFGEPETRRAVGQMKEIPLARSCGFHAIPLQKMLRLSSK
jgi:hypothetical protein